MYKTVALQRLTNPNAGHWVEMVALCASFHRVFPGLTSEASRLKERGNIAAGGASTTSQLVAQGLSLVPHGAQLFDEQRDDEQDAASCLQKDKDQIRVSHGFSLHNMPLLNRCTSDN